MDQSTQQNAALVEQATAAAQSLQQQAHQLAEVVAGFKLQAHDASDGTERLADLRLARTSSPAKPRQVKLETRLLPKASRRMRRSSLKLEC
jgi:methyl-accepting chemotaxis protein